MPTFLFINKIDLPGVSRPARMQEVRSLLSPDCADFSDDGWYEQAAAESEEALESFLSTGMIPPEEVRRLIREERLFPCLFGAALRLDGVEKLLDTLALYAPAKPSSQEFGARVYKISRDAQGARLTWLRVTGGSLHARSVLRIPTDDGAVEEKVHQIRLYSGEKYELTDTAEAGTVCAVTGLTAARTGDALGAEKGKSAALLEPVFTYCVHAANADAHTVLQKLRILEEEDPLLHVVYDDNAREIRVQLMGEVQLEILERLCRSRFGLEVTFGEGGILYRETIAAPVEGVGHYEPLRHYAEVHLLLTPLERGSGLQLESTCSTDELDLNWQRLILTHLAEKEHRGVLTGAPITDMKITLAAARAHLKHTEGGDFRQATYRAVRQGLMRADSILLEPWYDLRLELPGDCVGRAMADIQRMGGRFDPPVVLAVVWLLPVIYTVTTSFKSVAEFTSNAFNFLPAKWVLDNYMTLIEASASYPVLNWLGNSLIISTVFAVLSVCIVALAGFGYSRLNFKYRDTLFFVLLLISMFPAVVNMIPQYRIIASLGWVNTYWACIIPGLGNVANIFLVRNFMKGIPKELDEAAEIDGATDFQIFTRIMLPAIRPILIVIFLFSFTGAWNDFLWPTLVFNDINKMPVTAGLQLLSNQMGQYNQMGSLMAATCMAIIPTLLLFLFAQKYFLQSLNITSGLKG